MARSFLGKVFISHSSADKQFVRRLDKRLKRAGYDTWLDEHELLAGDPLGTKVAEGILGAQVVLVVVSRASIDSRWLQYELNLATNRMVKGDCRLIPLVIDDSELPAAVLGLLYSDFRGPFKYGFHSVESALQYENARATAQASFHIVATDLIYEAFGGHGSVSLDGAYADRSFSIVMIPLAESSTDSTYVMFDTESAYSEPAEPLTEGWWTEFSATIGDLPAPLFLIASERPIAFAAIGDEVGRTDLVYRRVGTSNKESHGGAVFLDLSNTARETWLASIKDAKRLLMRLAQELSAAEVTARRNWPTLLVWTSKNRRQLKIASS